MKSRFVLKIIKLRQLKIKNNKQSRTAMTVFYRHTHLDLDVFNMEAIHLQTSCN